jgi:hypothetical protein
VVYGVEYYAVVRHGTQQKFGMGISWAYGMVGFWSYTSSSALIHANES